MKGLAGSQVELADGTKVTADDAFILESITKPGAAVVKGFGAMPNLGVSDADAQAILAYIKSL
jgi:cytochrome c oxidase subunit 2